MMINEKFRIATIKLPNSTKQPNVYKSCKTNIVTPNVTMINKNNKSQIFKYTSTHNT